ncbi:MAG: conjugal transfer protein TraF [Thermodesulfobacteriota bacterium]
MRKSLIFIIAALFIWIWAPSAHAGPWSIVGPRALGMGGAGVAVANDATASYWNPAAYGFFHSGTKDSYGERDLSAAASLGLGTEIHEDIGDEINKLLAFDYNLLNTGQLSAERVSEFLQIINDLKGFDENSNRAATIIADAAFAVQYGHLGVGGYILGGLSAKGNLDLVNIVPINTGITGVDLITQLSTGANFNSGAPIPAGDFFFTSAEKQNLVNSISATSGWSTTTATDFVQAMDFGLSQAQASGIAVPADITTDITGLAQIASDAVTGGSFADNTSRLLFKGIGLLEVPLTYGVGITKNLAVGGNVKFMRARVYNTSVQVFNTNLVDAFETAKNDYEDSENFGVDIGVLYRRGDAFRFGIVGRNLNNPEFDMRMLLPDDKDHLTEESQVRAGIAVKPLSFLTLALDADITKNDTTISSSYKSQNVGGGLELNLFKVLNLRAGAYKNIAESDIGFVYTAGLGVNLFLINFDIGAAVASESTSIDSNDIPKEARVEAAFSMLF